MYSTQAKELEIWVEKRSHRMTIDTTSQEVKEQQEAEEWMRFINTTMAFVGGFSSICVLLALFLLISYWVSPWLVVSVVSLAGLILSITKARGRW